MWQLHFGENQEITIRHNLVFEPFLKKLDKASEKDFTGHGTEMDGRTLVSQKAASIFITDLLTLKGSG